MGCFVLANGDAPRAIPLRKLSVAQPILSMHGQAEGGFNDQSEAISPPETGDAPVHPDAAAIDIGATLHVAAVNPDRDPEPVRSFGTFTGD